MLAIVGPVGELFGIGILGGRGVRIDTGMRPRGRSRIRVGLLL